MTIILTYFKCLKIEMETIFFFQFLILEFKKEPSIEGNWYKNVGDIEFKSNSIVILIWLETEINLM